MKEPTENKGLHVEHMEKKGNTIQERLFPVVEKGSVRYKTWDDVVKEISKELREKYVAVHEKK